MKYIYYLGKRIVNNVCQLAGDNAMSMLEKIGECLIDRSQVRTDGFAFMVTDAPSWTRSTEMERHSH
jgi:hypothetical protein